MDNDIAAQPRTGELWDSTAATRGSVFHWNASSTKQPSKTKGNARRRDKNGIPCFWEHSSWQHRRLYGLWHHLLRRQIQIKTSKCDRIINLMRLNLQKVKTFQCYKIQPVLRIRVIHSLQRANQCELASQHYRYVYPGYTHWQTVIENMYSAVLWPIFQHMHCLESHKEMLNTRPE